MDVKRELESNYNIYKYQIDCLKEDLKMIDERCMPSITASYSEGGGHATGLAGDKVYSTVEKIDKEKERIFNQVSYLEHKIKKIDSLINTQNHKTATVIRLRAIEGKDFELITQELKSENNLEIYSSSYTKELYYKGLKRMQDIVNKVERGL